MMKVRTKMRMRMRKRKRKRKRSKALDYMYSTHTQRLPQCATLGSKLTRGVALHCPSCQARLQILQAASIMAGLEVDDKKYLSGANKAAKQMEDKAAISSAVFLSSTHFVAESLPHGDKVLEILLPFLADKCKDEDTKFEDPDFGPPPEDVRSTLTSITRSHSRPPHH